MVTETDNEKLLDVAAGFVVSMMRSASTDNIDPYKWWERARTALETGAATANTFGELVSIMAKKLQIDVLNAATTAEVNRLAPTLRGEAFEPFRQVCESQAVFIVALAQGIREDEREQAGFVSGEVRV